MTAQTPSALAPAAQAPSAQRRVRHLVSRGSAAEAAGIATRRLARLLAVSDEGTSVAVEWRADRRGEVASRWSAEGLSASDLEWALDPVAVLGSGSRHWSPLPSPGFTVYRLDADPGDPLAGKGMAIGFASIDQTRDTLLDITATGHWTPSGVAPADDLLGALREAKAHLKVTAWAAPLGARAELIDRLGASGLFATDAVSAYVGVPLRVSAFVAVPPGTVGARLKAAIAVAVPHVRWKVVGTAGTAPADAAWDLPFDAAQVLPGEVGQALLLVPAVHPAMVVPGVRVEAPPARERPVRHRNGKGATLMLARATGHNGARTQVAMSPVDARRHTQIVGQTGAGKSTAEIAMALTAARAGHGLTFLDPHGSTVRRLLGLLPEEALLRTVVIRLADTDHPVRACMWPSLEAHEVEYTIAELNALFRAIFDPNVVGMVGARFERWFTLYAKACVALFGRFASFDTIVAVSSTVELTRRLARAIRDIDPETSRALAGEYGQLAEKEFTEVLSWAASKMQRFTSVAALRETFGSGADALSFADRLAARDIVLIDLGMPTLGAAPSQMAGTLLLEQLWRAVTARGVIEDPDQTHFVFIDEAQRFQHGALPTMLAEGRKFGLAVTVAHQHMGQLVPEVREALEANTGSLVAFRTSPTDAAPFGVRLGAEVAGDLPRLGNLTALASLCVDGSPTPAFTMTFEHPRAVRTPEEGDSTATARTRAELVEPFRDTAPLTGMDAIARLNEAFDAARTDDLEKGKTRIQSLRSKYDGRLAPAPALSDEDDEDDEAVS